MATDLIVTLSAADEVIDAVAMNGISARGSVDAITLTFGCDACAFAGGLAVLDDQFSVQRDGLCSLTAGRRDDDRKDQFV